MKLKDVPKPYTMHRSKFIMASRYSIWYDDTELFSGLDRNTAFRMTGALNGAFMEGVIFAGGVN
jgi:hypothetical protein